MTYRRNFEQMEEGERVLCRDGRHGVVLSHSGSGHAVFLLEDKSDEIFSSWQTNISGTYDLNGKAAAKFDDYSKDRLSKPTDPTIPSKLMTQLKRKRTKVLKTRKEA